MLACKGVVCVMRVHVAKRIRFVLDACLVIFHVDTLSVVGICLSLIVQVFLHIFAEIPFNTL